MLVGLFSLLKALPIRFYLWAAGLLAVSGLIVGMRLDIDYLKHQNAALRAEKANLLSYIDRQDQAIKLQNESIEAWKEAGVAKARQAAEAQAQAQAWSQQNDKTIKALKDAQVPSDSDKALLWLARNYNEWMAKVQP